MAHVRTADNSQSVCTGTEEFDVIVLGDTVVFGPQPTNYCRACNEAEPYWEIVSDEEFERRWPLE